MAETRKLLWPFLVLVGITILRSPSAARAGGAAPADPPNGARVALIQYNADAHFADVEHNLSRLTAFAEEAVDEGASLVMFPEGSMVGYVGKEQTWCAPGRRSCYGRSCRSVTEVAESVPHGPTTDYWHDFASENDVFVAYHLIERDQDSYYNAMALVGPTGFVGKYRKRLLYGPDHCYARRGMKLNTVSLPFGRFGLLICADANEDPFFRRYAARDVDGVLIPMNWDQSAEGPRAARLFFARKAAKHGLDLFISDNSQWDGTAKYEGEGGRRERVGLTDPALGEAGTAVVEMN